MPAASSTAVAAAGSLTRSRYDVPPSRSSTTPDASIRPLPMMVALVHTCCTSARMCELSSTVTPALAEVADQLADLPDAGRVEAVGRLVEDQQVGRLEQRRRDGEPLLHPERVGLEAVLGAVTRARPWSGPRRRPSSATPTDRASSWRFWRAGEGGGELRRLHDRTDPADHVGEPIGHRACRGGASCRRWAAQGRAASGWSWSCPDPLGPRKPCTPPRGTARSRSFDRHPRARRGR